MTEQYTAKLHQRIAIAILDATIPKLDECDPSDAMQGLLRAAIIQYLRMCHTVSPHIQPQKLTEAFHPLLDELNEACIRAACKLGVPTARIGKDGEIENVNSDN